MEFSTKIFCHTRHETVSCFSFNRDKWYSPMLSSQKSKHIFGKRNQFSWFIVILSVAYVHQLRIACFCNSYYLHIPTPCLTDIFHIPFDLFHLTWTILPMCWECSKTSQMELWHYVLGCFEATVLVGASIPFNYQWNLCFSGVKPSQIWWWHNCRRVEKMYRTCLAHFHGLRCVYWYETAEKAVYSSGNVGIFDNQSL